MSQFSMPDDDICYTALKAKDPRFDGRFFVGVSSTGIYCRAICPAKVPKRENCTFFPTAAVAEAAGYRPCLKCRPELAPAIPASIEGKTIAHLVALMLQDGPVEQGGIKQIAESLAVSERQLRRLFLEEYRVSPIQYRNTCRLLLAKNLLTDTMLSITQVALVCGFSSIRRFNDAFLAHYSLSPSRFRKAEGKGAERSVTLYLNYRPPYRYDLLLSFFAGRAIAGVESVKDGVYSRTVSIKRGRQEIKGWIKIENRPEKNALAITISPELLPVLPLVLGRIRRMFDLDCIPDTIDEALAGFYCEVPDAYHLPGLRLPGCFDGFEMAVRAILGQQITVKAANTLAARIAAEFGQQAYTPFSDLTHTFPAAKQFTAPDAIDKLGQLGVIHRRASAIVTLAEAVESGAISLQSDADIQTESASLAALPGFGPWTVQYLAMRIFKWPDSFLYSDYAVKKAFPGMSPKQLLSMSEAWRPWRSYAVVSIWCDPHT